MGAQAAGREAKCRAQCEVEVTNRARQILLQAGAVTSSSYYSLETLLQSAEKMPGSKLAFFISDGFLADTGPRSQVGRDRLGRITDNARRAGVVIYTIDARGLISGALDATGSVSFDSGGMLENANLREIAATQDALHSLAVDTGGRALRNQNEFDQFINVALDETSRYYLIAWRPEASDEKDDKLRKITVSVIRRPELTVRSARGFASRSAVASANDERKSEAESGKSTRAKQPDADIQDALKDFLSKTSASSPSVSDLFGHAGQRQRAYHVRPSAGRIAVVRRRREGSRARDNCWGGAQRSGETSLRVSALALKLTRPPPQRRQEILRTLSTTILLP